jgi:predicted NodU family carbamoyl transferase
MAVKIYSDVTKKFYDDEAAALKAEEEVKALAEEKTTRRKQMADTVDVKRTKCEQARKTYEKAREEYHDALDKFCKEYGAYHYTMTDKDVEDFFDSSWPWLW